MNNEPQHDVAESGAGGKHQANATRHNATSPSRATLAVIVT